MDVDTFAIESFESVEGADDKSEKTGGVRWKPVSLSSCAKGDGGDKDASCFDTSSEEPIVLLILFMLCLCYVVLCCVVLCYVYDKLILATSNTNTMGYYKNEYTSYIILI